MWPDNTIPSIYDLSLPTDTGSVWRFKQRPPDVILINLATNDFGRAAPQRQGWTAAYAGFIGHLRRHDPKARVYCAIGPMMSGQSVTTLREYLHDVLDARASAGDRNIAIIDFGVQDREKNGLGSDWHPSLKTHRQMGEQLAATVKADLGF
jgi:lysophospholipase L1-like esterase